LWFDGNVQKIVSVSASLFTASFARAFPSEKLAAFDSRLMVISQLSEVENYFLWRQLDASANSLNMLASAHFSHDELVGKSNAEKHDLLHARGLNWAKQGADFKRGRVVRQRDDKSGWMVDVDIPIFNRIGNTWPASSPDSFSTDSMKFVTEPACSIPASTAFSVRFIPDRGGGEVW